MKALSRLQRRFAYAWPAVTFAVALLAMNVAIDRSFLDLSNWPSILAVAMPFILVSMAAAPAIISGGIDLSIGPAAGIVNAALIAWLAPVGWTSPLVIIAATLGIGLVIGAVNGVVIAWLRVPSIIATLGSYLVLSGLTLEILPMSGGRAPDWMIALGGRIGVFPLPLVIPLCVFLAWALVRASAFGRNLLASGGEPRAAFASGIDVALTRFVAYVASSIIAAVTGFAFTVSLGSGDPTAATPYTLIGIAGAVLGGVSLSGGRGGLLGAAAGGAVLFLVQNLLSLAHVSAFYAQIAYGVILLAALALNGLSDRARHRRDRAASHRFAQNAAR
jgi:ribose transport system permease protein